MGNMDVTARLLADNAQFDAAMDKSAATATATGVATEKATKRAADATKFASQFAADAIQKGTDAQVSSMLKLRAAQEDYARAQKIVRAGYLDAQTGAQTLGAALQRLTAAQDASAEASRRVAAASKESGKGFQDVAERVVLSSVGYIAAATGIRDILGSMKEAVTSSLEFGESIERASQKTNLSVKTLSTLHYAAAVTGGDFDALSKGVGKLDVSIAEAANGNKEMEAYFTALGLNAKDLAGNSNGAQIALQRLAVAMADTSGPEKQLVAQKLLSKAGIDQIPTLTKLGENWDKYTQGAKAAGVLLDSGTAESLEATNERLRVMDQRIQGAKLAFTEGLMPGLNAFGSTLDAGGVKVSIFTKLAQELTKQLNFGAAAAFSFGASLDTIRAYTYDLGVKKDRDADLAASARERAKAEQFDKNARGGDAAAQGSTPGGGDDSKPKTQLHVVDPAAAAAAEAAARKAAEAKLKGMEAELAEMKQQNSVTVQSEYQFWQDRIGAFKKGSDQYNAIVEKEASLAVEGAKAAGEALRAGMKKIRETQNLSPDDANRAIAENAQQQSKLGDNLTQTGQRWREYNTEVAKNAELMIKSAQAAREAQIEHGVKTGSLSKANAAQQMGDIHKQTAELEIAELRRQLAIVQQDQAKVNLYTPQGAEDASRLAAQGQGIQNQIASVNAAANLQAVKDAYSAFAETGLGGAVSALQAFTAASMDSAAQMKQIVDSVLNNVNKAILADLTEKHTRSRGAWKDAGKSIFTDVAGSALKKGEGSLFSAIGLGGGKLGTRSNPMFVKNADALATGAASTAASALSKSGGLFSGLLSKMVGFLPAFADGGDFGAGTTALVGEQGPEVVHFGSAGHVTPNGKSPSSGAAGDTHHTWNIDARGSSDPAQTMALVRQGIMEAAPHIVAASMKARTDHNSRLPPSACS